MRPLDFDFFRTADGAINLAHPAIKNQYWLIESRLKGLSDETILKALAQYALHFGAAGT